MNYRIGILVCLLAIVKSQITYEECKRDCTSDWIDCGGGCESIGNPQYCHVTCQNIVHKCLDECPYVVCIDKCRDKLESCRRSGTVCETQYDECKYICDDTYLGYEVRTNDDL